MSKVTFIAPEGERIVVDAMEDTVMEATVIEDLEGIEGDCAGVCSCCTCHVHVEPEWMERVGKPRKHPGFEAARPADLRPTPHRAFQKETIPNPSLEAARVRRSSLQTNQKFIGPNPVLPTAPQRFRPPHPQVPPEAAIDPSRMRSMLSGARSTRRLPTHPDEPIRPQIHPKAAGSGRSAGFDQESQRSRHPGRLRGSGSTHSWSWICWL